MATYTVAELKARTGVPIVASLGDTRILMLQTQAESILSSLDLDTSVSGYSDAFSSALIYLFDWLAGMPAGAKEFQEGKTRTTAYDNLPPQVTSILRKYISGDQGIMGAPLERNDIGLE